MVLLLDRFAVEDDDAVLIDDRGAAAQPSLLGDDLDDFAARGQGIAWIDGRPPMQGLRDRDPAGALQERAVHRREQAGGKEPVRDAAAEARRFRVFFVDVDLVLVAADGGEEQ